MRLLSVGFGSISDFSPSVGHVRSAAGSGHARNRPLCHKQSFELWLSSIIGVTAYSQKHAPTINPRMKLISLSKSNLCPRPHPCRTPHSAVVFGGRPPRPGGTTTKNLCPDPPIPRSPPNSFQTPL